MDRVQLKHLNAVEKKLLWLACWTIHNTNHLRERTDGVKVGGHQASSASMVSIMTASGKERSGKNLSREVGVR